MELDSRLRRLLPRKAINPGQRLGQAVMSTAKIILKRADAKIGTALFLLFTTALVQANQNTATDFVIHTKMNDRLPRLQTALPRYVQVFGWFIQATERVPDSKLLHAADIAADFLDNDRDGKPDLSLIHI